MGTVALCRAVLRSLTCLGHLSSCSWSVYGSDLRKGQAWRTEARVLKVNGVVAHLWTACDSVVPSYGLLHQVFVLTLGFAFAYKVQSHMVRQSYHGFCHVGTRFLIKISGIRDLPCLSEA